MNSAKQVRRTSALERLKESTWENSKACRTGSKTKEQWQQWKDNEVARLSK